MSIHRWETLTREFNSAMRRTTAQTRRLMWAMRNATPSDEEQFAMRLAVRHVREGNIMLAQEDLAWLEKRLAAR